MSKKDWIPCGYFEEEKKPLLSFRSFTIADFVIPYFLGIPQMESDAFFTIA